MAKSSSGSKVKRGKKAGSGKASPAKQRRVVATITAGSGGSFAAPF